MKFFSILLIIIAQIFATSCFSSDFGAIRRRLVMAEEYKNIKELDVIANSLSKQAEQNEMARFLLGKALFLKGKVKDQNAGVPSHNLPHLYTNGRDTQKAVLLIHGFTASPWEMSDLGKYLKNHEINAYAMRVAGHGTKPEDLHETTWQDWYAGIVEALKITSMLGDEVYVVGLSAGGTLAVKLAAEHGDRIKGIVTLAPAIYLQDWRSSFAGIGQFFLKYNLRPLEDKFKPYYYEKRPVAAIWELVKLTRHARREAQNVTIPMLIIQSKDDKAVQQRGASFLYSAVNSENVELIWLEGNIHVLTTFENPLQAKVFEDIMTFLNK